jgi:hypothetical protein
MCMSWNSDTFPTREELSAALTSQTRPFDASLPVDAVLGVGFNWLCGPYGTGFVYDRL